MKLTVKTQGSIVKAIKAEYTPAEWLVVEAAMRKYAKSREVGVVDRQIIKQMLSVEPVEEESADAKKMGRWISFGPQGEIDGQIVRAFTCSECGAISIFRLSGGNIVNGDLCPNCGARMGESEGNND